MTTTGTRPISVVKKSCGFGACAARPRNIQPPSKMRRISSSKMSGSSKIARLTRKMPSPGRSSISAARRASNNTCASPLLSPIIPHSLERSIYARHHHPRRGRDGLPVRGKARGRRRAGHPDRCRRGAACRACARRNDPVRRRRGAARPDRRGPRRGGRRPGRSRAAVHQGHAQRRGGALGRASGRFGRRRAHAAKRRRQCGGARRGVRAATAS